VSAPTLNWQGERCLVLQWEMRIDAAVNAAVHAAATRLQAAPPAALRDLVPAYASLALYFDADAPLDHAAVQQAVGALLAGSAPPADAAENAGRCVAIPVCYHPTLAPDLEAAAAALGLSLAQLVARHSAPRYRVAMLGFTPGFPYLLGLDPTLALPRHTQPRARVAAGSVGIAGAQTGIYPQASPGGWQLIGRTPLRLFAPERDPPCPLSPGDEVRFVPIDLAAFHAAAEPA
jgi:KipI family sensor histidine kinase inhibitor